MPWELSAILDKDLVDQGLRELDLISRLEDDVMGLVSDKHRVASLEMNWYMRSQLLRDADWAGMAHSLEVRVPFVDLALLRSVASIERKGKVVSKQDMVRSVSGELPRHILKRRKTGFSIPLRSWIGNKRSGRGRGRTLREWALIVYGRFSERGWPKTNIQSVASSMSGAKGDS